MPADPFGRAIRDYYLDEQAEPLVVRDGEEWREHPIERFYFWEHEEGDWKDSWLDGPLIDIGAGVGAHALTYQGQFETVAIEISEHLVETMRDRGVEDARRVDMFSLRDAFDRDRFQSALVFGTQVGLVGSMDGLREFLSDLAFVTRPDATAVLHCYDPELDATENLLGFRDDPTPGLAYRVMHFEYDGAVGETLLFRLFSPERLRAATVGTGWEVAEVRHVPPDDPTDQYEAALTKS